MSLRLAHSRAHDLPPLWDGRRVDWSEWQEVGPTSMVFHGWPDEMACTGCGWIPETKLHAIGRLHPEPGATFTVPKTVGSKRRLGTYTRNVEVTAWPVARLSVRRCSGCGVDEVTDIETGEVWDLEGADYTDAGSWPDDLPVQDTLF